MRSLFVLTLLCACGGSSPKPASHEVTATVDAAPAVVAIDVTTPPKLAAYSTTLSRISVAGIYMLYGDSEMLVQGSYTAMDRSYAVEVSDGSISITFTVATEGVEGVTVPSVLGQRSYVIAGSSVLHGDGTAVAADEYAALSAFNESGGFGVPVRDALAGHRLEQGGEPLKLDAMGITNLVVFAAPDDATAEVVLAGIDDAGIATLTLKGSGTLPTYYAVWEITGTITAEAATLNPRSVQFEIKIEATNPEKSERSTITSTQTFTY